MTVISAVFLNDIEMKRSLHNWLREFFEESETDYITASELDGAYETLVFENKKAKAEELNAIRKSLNYLLVKIILL